MLKKSHIQRCLVGASFGFMPGAFLFAFVSSRVGLAIAGLGALVGAGLALPGVSPARTFKLLGATLLRYNLPASDRIYDWVDDESSDTPDSEDFDNAFSNWIFGSDIVHRRRWLVLTGLGVGLVVGATLSFHDLSSMEAGGNGVLLPLAHSKDSDLTQAVLATIGCAIWTGSATGVVASAAFRRPILFSVGFASIISGLIGYAADSGNGPGPIGFAFFFSTGAAATAIIVAACISPGDFDKD